MVQASLKTAMVPPILSLRDISTSIDGHQILHNISLEFHKHLVTTIVGPSGSGKTTLLRTINLLRVPAKGQIVFEGEVVFDGASEVARKLPGVLNRVSEMFGSSEVEREYRRRFGVVFQDYNLWPNLTIYNNIAAPLRWSLRLSEEEVRRRIEEQASIVRIGHILKKYPGEASGGERQRAAIARALVTNPDILLFDEVTSALDVELAAEILKVILVLKERGHTMVLVTHHLRFAERISDNVVFLANGRIKEKGEAKALFADPTTPELRQFLEHLKL